jgi:hypothetical protein
MKTINDTAPESTGIPRSVLYFNGDKKFKTKIKRINEIKRTENQPNFSVGDIVRISKQVLDKEVRKQIKQGNSKLVTVQLSKELYRVVKVLQSNKLIKSRYRVENLQGELLPIILNDNDLLSVDFENLEKNKNLTTKKVEKLNNVKANEPTNEIQTRGKDYKRKLRDRKD